MMVIMMNDDVFIKNEKKRFIYLVTNVGDSYGPWASESIESSLGGRVRFNLFFVILILLIVIWIKCKLSKQNSYTSCTTSLSFVYQFWMFVCVCVSVCAIVCVNKYYRSIYIYIYCGLYQKFFIIFLICRDAKCVSK